jgi:hypothetical protein
MSRELGDLRKGTKESAPPEKESAPAEQPFDIESVLEPLGPVLDEDAGKAVSQTFKDLQARNDAQLAARDARIAALEAKLNGVLPEVEQSRTKRLMETVEATAAGLKERFPQLGDKEFLSNEILPTMALLNRKDENGKNPYTDPERLMEDACKLKCEQTPAPTPTPLRPAKRAASPITETRKAAPRPMTWDQKADLAMTELDKGKTVEQVRALLPR